MQQLMQRRSPSAGRRRVAPLCLAMAATVAVIVPGGARQASPDPFEFLRPIATIPDGDRRAIDRGEARARTLSGEGREVVVLGIVAAGIDAARLRAWVQRIEAMKRSAAVRAIARFSTPPRIEDLQSLALDDEDLNAIRDCQPGDCGLKLGAAEMRRLQAATGGRSDWRAALQEAFRALMLDRVTAYRARGHAGLPAYDDTAPARRPADAFGDLLARSRPLLDRVPPLVASLGAPPPVSDDAFLYWANEQFGGKPVLSVTDVRIVEPAGGPALPLVVVAGTQVFATHYRNGSLNLTMLLRGREGGPNYLVFLNRSEVDVIGGFFGGIARAIVQRRVRSEASEVIVALRTRLESGPPPRLPPE